MRFFNLPTYSNTPGGTESIPSSDANNTDRRFTLSGLAKWIIENFTGSTLAGSAQSVKSAVNGLKTRLDPTTVTPNYDNTLITLNRSSITKVNGYCYMSVSFTTLSTIQGNVAILTDLPAAAENFIDVNISSSSYNGYIGLITNAGVFRFGSTTYTYPVGTYVVSCVYKIAE